MAAVGFLGVENRAFLANQVVPNQEGREKKRKIEDSVEKVFQQKKMVKQAPLSGPCLLPDECVLNLGKFLSKKNFIALSLVDKNIREIIEKNKQEIVEQVRVEIKTMARMIRGSISIEGKEEEYFQQLVLLAKISVDANHAVFFRTTRQRLHHVLQQATRTELRQMIEALKERAFPKLEEDMAISSLFYFELIGIEKVEEEPFLTQEEIAFGLQIIDKVPLRLADKVLRKILKELDQMNQPAYSHVFDAICRLTKKNNIDQFMKIIIFSLIGIANENETIFQDEVEGALKMILAFKDPEESLSMLHFFSPVLFSYRDRIEDGGRCICVHLIISILTSLVEQQLLSQNEAFFLTFKEFLNSVVHAMDDLDTREAMRKELIQWEQALDHL